MPFSIGNNSSNFNNLADWNGANGNVTSVGTNGGVSAFGTRDQCGNVWEWTEGVYGDTSRGLMGGAWNSNETAISYLGITSADFNSKSNNIGFRLISLVSSLIFSKFINIGDVNNTADTRNGKGSVSYYYDIMVNPVTNQEYVEFLNSVDPSGTNANLLYSSLMNVNSNGSNNTRGGIVLNVNNGIGQKYSVKFNFANKPVVYVSFINAARMANWLHNNKSPTSIDNGAYTISGSSVTRNPSAKYAIPTEDEWYKAAYYKGGGTDSGYWSYATQSDSTPCPVGSIGCAAFNINNGDGGIVNILPTPTPTTTVTPTPTITSTSTVTPTNTTTPTVTNTSFATSTPTPTLTPTQTQTQTPTVSLTSSITPTRTTTPTRTPTRTPTNTPTATTTNTPTRTQTRTPTRTNTATPTVTPTRTVTPTVTRTTTPTVSVSPDAEYESPYSLNKYFNLKSYPSDSTTQLSLFVPPSSIVPNDPVVNDWNKFIESIEIVYGSPDASEKPFFTTISSGNKTVADPSSTLKALIPGQPYYFILKDYAELPVKLPIITKEISRFLPPFLVDQLKTITINDSESKVLSSASKISYLKAISTLKKDVENNPNNKQLQIILSNILTEYAKYGNDCIGTIGIEQDCATIYKNSINSQKYNFEPSIIVNSGNEIPQSTISGQGILNSQLNIKIFDLPQKDKNISSNFYFRSKDSKLPCSIFPISGSIQPDASGNYNISSVFTFYKDSSLEANLFNISPTPTPTNTRTPTPTRTSTRTPTPTRSVTPTNTRTPTVTPTRTPTNTVTPTRTVTPTNTRTPTMTPTPSSTFAPRWIQRGSDINGEASGDNSGRSVSLNSAGDVVAIRANLNDGTGADSGHVRVYSWNGSSWDQRGSDINGEASGDQSGYSVSLNSAGDVVAIGAPLNNGNGTSSGHIRVYSWNGSSWVQRGIDINGETSGDLSGWSVSLNSAGDVVAIGAPNNDNVSGINSGHVRVYSWNGSSWIQQGSDINGEASGDQSGYSVSLNSAGDVVAIGAINNGTGTSSGHVRVYSWNGSSWVQRGSDINGEASGDNSGYSVSLNSAGDVVAIGAPNNDNVSGINSGHVRVYSWNGSSWVQRGSDINGEASGDQSGYSVSLNSAGDVVAIGAPLNNGTGAESGHVRVYSWNGSSWVQRGSDINGEASGDQSGYSVSLNSAGDVVAIGAPNNDNVSGINSGHVRVYRFEQ